MTFFVKKAEQSDIDELYYFRKNQYLQVKNFEITNDEYFKLEDNEITYLVIVNNEIIASMSGTFLQEGDSIYDFVNSLSDTKQNNTILYITKSFTDFRYMNKGFNSLLRLIFIELAEKYSVTKIVGVVYLNTRRINLMKKLEYKFYEVGNLTPKNVLLKNKKECCVSILSNESFLSAINFLSNYLSSDIVRLKSDELTNK